MSHRTSKSQQDSPSSEKQHSVYPDPRFELSPELENRDIDSIAPEVAKVLSVGAANKKAQAEALCILYIDCLNGGKEAACSSKSSTNRVSIRSLCDHKALADIPSSKSQLSKLIRLGRTFRRIERVLNANEAESISVEDAEVMARLLDHDKVLVEVIEEFSAGEIERDKLAKVVAERKPRATKRPPLLGALGKDRKFLKSFSKRHGDLAEDRKEPDPSAWTFPELADIEHGCDRLEGYIVAVRQMVERTLAAKRKVIADSGADPDEVEAGLLEPAKENALACTSARATTMDSKLVHTLKVESASRRGSLYATGPKMATAYAPTELCRHGCSVGDICYTSDIASVNTLNKLFRESGAGLRSVDPTRAWVEKASRLFVGGVPHDGGRDGKQGRDFRVNNSGDCHTPEEAAMVAEVARIWGARGGGAFFGFTRFWRVIPRSVLGPARMLASCRLDEAPAALAAGYPAAVVVEDVSSARDTLKELGIKVPVYWCPYQAREAAGRPLVPCVRCRICIDHKHPLFVVLFVAEGGADLVAAERLARGSRG